MKQLFVIIIYVLSVSMIQAQTYTIKSIIIDEKNLPIEAVTCMLQRQTDSTTIRTEITDSLGRFTFTDIPVGNYNIFLQHLAYDNETYPVSISSNEEIQPMTLFSKSMELAGIVVKGERPLVKATGGKLAYNIPGLIQNRIVSNAFEALRTIPNIAGGGDDIRLTGADKFTILINSQPTSLSKDQLIQVLKNTPASRIKSIEIMYSAPPQYNIRGAAINVIFNSENADLPEFQGEVNAIYDQAQYSSYKTRANFVFNKPSYSIDFTLGGDLRKARNHSVMHAIHELDNNSYDIHQTNHSVPKGKGLNTRFAFDYRFANKDKMNLTYTGEFSDYKSDLISNAKYQENKVPMTDIDSYSRNNGDDQLHNLHLDFNSHSDFRIGADYTIYKEPGTQKYSEYENNIQINDYKTKTKQKVDKITLYANHKISLPKDWVIDYGANFSHARNNNDYNHFLSVHESNPDSISLTRQREYSGNIYAGFTKSFTDKFTAQASVSGNYFKATIDNTKGKKETLWDEFKPFVNANLTYAFSDRHILQYSFTSDIEYPPYWALSPDVVQLNSYSIVRGNPELKFSRSYESQLIYIFRNKYMLIGSYKYNPDHFTQLPLQSEEELVNIFQVENLDYRKSASLSLVLPFKISSIVDSRATLSYIYMKEKDSNFLNQPYSRSKNIFNLDFNSTINISSKPNIKMDISAFYINRYMQGVYDIDGMYSIDAGVKWTFLNNRAELSGKVTDIFGGMDAKTSVDYANQWSTMTKYSDTPSFRLSFVYKFGNYKKKATNDVDKSRFGRSN